MPTKCKICGAVIEDDDFFWYVYEEEISIMQESQIVLYKICLEHQFESIKSWNMLYAHQEKMQALGKIVVPIVPH